MSARLVLDIHGAGLPPTPLPEHGALVVGSDARRAQFVLAAPGVDPVHCAFVRAKDGRWAVKDLGSAGGTHLNGQRVAAAAVKHGDTVRVAGVELVLRDPDLRQADKPATNRKEDAKAPEPVAFELEEISLEEPPRAATPASGAPKVRGFRLEKQLGKGGMGVVWLAVQENLDRKVALKLLASKHSSDAKFVAQFQREARAAAALNHPNVVTVYDVGEDSGVHYLSMEYMERGTLEDRIAGGRALSSEEVLSILLDATAGLVYAEQRGIVHRDIKPANLMQNHVGQTKIADLGLATHAEGEEPPAGEKKVFGTPHFMSPEQIRGERLDARSDLWSLGATAYRLLSGRTPFEGRDTKEIVRAVLTSDPRPLRETAPGADARLVALVEMLLQRDPARRPASAAQLLARLDQLSSAPAGRAAGATLPAQPPQPAAAASASARSSSAGPLVAMLLVAGSGATAWFTKDKWLPLLQQGSDGEATARGDGESRGPGRDETGRPAASSSTAASEAARTDQAASAAGAGAPGRDPARSTARGPGDKDDKDLQIFEQEARIASLTLESQADLTPAQRRAKLQELAAKYAGTTSAAEAQRKADELGAALDAASAAKAERSTRIEAVVAKLRGACDFEAPVPQPARSLLAMRLVEGAAELKDDPEFVARRRDLELALLHKARDWGSAVLEEVGRLKDKGQFEEAEARLKLAVEVFELPTYGPDDSPAGYNDMQVVGRRLREQLVNWTAVKSQFVQRQTVEDRRVLARELGGARGLEADLAAFDFAAAIARVEATREKVASPAARASTEALKAQLAAARDGLAFVGANHASWRRRGVVDPRERKPANKESLGADAEGVLVEGNSGPERIPWSAYGKTARDLHKLFNERLNRSLKPDEQAMLAAAMRMAALNETLDMAGKALDPTKKANWTEQSQKDLLEAWRTALEWEKTPGATAQEAEAAKLLGQALKLGGEGAWSSCVSALERLVAQHADTMLVRMLSDGRTLEELAPAAPGGTGK
ncbi:MAG: Serine/threonine-protein kinase PrkC [Planctomycetota bacterium]